MSLHQLVSRAETEDYRTARWKAQLLSSWYDLRRRGKLQPLLAEFGILWTFSDRQDPWGSRERLTWEQLEQQVTAELRKGPGYESQKSDQRSSEVRQVS